MAKSTTKSKAPKSAAPSTNGDALADRGAIDNDLLAKAIEQEHQLDEETIAVLKKKNSGKDEPVNSPLSSARIDLPEFPVAWRRIIIEGVTPLLTNAVSPRVLDQIAFEQGGGKKEKKPRIPVNEYFEHHHLAYGVDKIEALTENLYGFPAVGIKKALCQTIGLIYTKTTQNAVSPWIFINGPYNGLVAITNKPVEDASHEAFMENRGRSEMRRDPTYLWKMGQGKILTPCYRPMFHPWSMTLDVRINPDVLNDQSLLRAFTALGTLTTFGSYRRNRGGDFGCFSIKRVMALKDDYQPAAKWGSTNG